MQDSPRHHDAHCNHTKAHTTDSAASDPFARHPSGPSVKAPQSNSPTPPFTSAFCTAVYPVATITTSSDASPALTACMPLAPARGLIPHIAICGFIAFSPPSVTTHHPHAACSCGPPSPTTWALPRPRCRLTPTAAGLPLTEPRPQTRPFLSPLQIEHTAAPHTSRPPPRDPLQSSPRVFRNR